MSAPPSPMGTPLRVLVVDDDEPVLQSTTRLLDTLGFKAYAVSRVEDVAPLMRREQVDVVLHDILMPGLDLESHVAALRADPRTAHVPIILFSASFNLDRLRVDLKVEGLLEKPFRPPQLVRAVTSVVEASRAARSADPVSTRALQHRE
ncbi:MAG TPA: response regulator [Candidatus Thermoplasmatota archaeon]|nr:response regulator [Candidatus Thermoplasmatota archaeon]